MLPSDNSRYTAAETAPVRTERIALLVILLVAFVHGLIYVVLMPPWQHYEEPTHFEYARMTADQSRPPPYDAFDATLRREIAASMMEHDFFRDLDFEPTLWTNDPTSISIGVNVKGSVPFYPLLASVPLRLTPHLDVASQLYVARLLSLILYVGTIGIAYAITAELVPTGHPLRWSVPLLIALLPGFTELMSAVNNDVGATVAFSLFVLAALRLITHGISIGRLLLLVLTAVLCAGMKNTVLVAVPLAVVVVGLAFARRHSFRLVSVVLLAGILVTLPMVFRWGDAALWYRDRSQGVSTRVTRQEAPSGRHAIRMEGASGVRLRQPLPHTALDALRGKPVTLGGWIWASAPVRAQAPVLAADAETTAHAVDLTTTPTFYTLHARIAEDTERVQIIISGPSTSEVSVFYDGIVLAEGARPLETIPTFDDADGTRGTWAGAPFVNYVRNGSAERAWPWVRPTVERLFREGAEAHLSASTVLAAVLDVEYTSWLYGATADRIVQTLWGRFGWAHVALPFFWYRVLTIVTAAGALGGGWALLRVFTSADTRLRTALVVLGLAALAIWIPTLLRGFFTVGRPNVYIPTARYAFPAIVPTMLFLVTGWYHLVPLRRRWSSVILVVGFLMLDATAIVTIIGYYSAG